MPFVKGQSANPGGRPRIVQSVRRRAQGHMEEALDVALEVMRKGEKGTERLTAAVKVLQIAGVPFTADGATEAEPAKPLTPSATEAELEAAAAAGEG